MSALGLLFLAVLVIFFETITSFLVARPEGAAQAVCCICGFDSRYAWGAARTPIPEHLTVPDYD